MGGRGTFAAGRCPEPEYRPVAYIEGVAVLRPIDATRALKLPEESHSPNTAYLLLDWKGVFRQYREYDARHNVTLEIGYHREPSLGKGMVLHIHVYDPPGIANRPKAVKRLLTEAEAKKYGKFFIGVRQ